MLRCPCGHLAAEHFNHEGFVGCMGATAYVPSPCSCTLSPLGNIRTWHPQVVEEVA